MIFSSQIQYNKPLQHCSDPVISIMGESTTHCFTLIVGMILAFTIVPSGMKISNSEKLSSANYINALMLFHCKWYILDMASTTSLACCRAMNAKCNSCAQGKTIDEYCRENEKVEGCFGILIIRTTSLKIYLAIIRQILKFLLQVLFILNSRD